MPIVGTILKLWYLFLKTMATVGYARVSSIGQSLEVQQDKLHEYGCTKIYQEKRSGTTANRPELQQCIDYVRDGDVLVITKLL